MKEEFFFSIKAIIDEYGNVKQIYEDEEYIAFQKLGGGSVAQETLYENMDVHSYIGRCKNGKYYYCIVSDTDLEDEEIIKINGKDVCSYCSIVCVLVDNFDELVDLLKEYKYHINDKQLTKIALEEDMVGYLLTK